MGDVQYEPLKIALSNRFFAGKGFSGLLNQYQALGGDLQPRFL